MSKAPDSERNPTSSFALAVWYVVMIFSSASLYVLGIISIDNTVNFYVALAVITMTIIPVVKIIKTIKELKELNGQEKRRLQLAARRANQSDEDREELEKAKLMATNNFANRHTAKSDSAKKT